MTKKNVSQKLQQAVLMHNNGELDSAEALYREVLEIDHSNYYALRFLGCLFRLKGRYEEGINCLRAAISVRPADADTHLNLGRILADSGAYDSAIHILEECITLKSDFAEAYQTLGYCLSQIGKLPQSVEKLLKAVELNKLLVQSWFNLGNTYMMLGKIQDAIESYQQSIRISPNFYDAYINLGVAYSEDGDSEKSLQIYLKAIRINPNSACAFTFIAGIFQNRGEIDKAIAMYREAIRLDPNYIGSLFGLASLLKGRGEYKEAINLYHRVLLIDGSHVNSIAGLGWSYLSFGNPERGINYYESVLRGSLNDTDSLFFLFELVRGNIEKKIKSSFSYSSEFLLQSLDCLGVSKLIAFGDSHVLLFEGINEIEVNHVGASTAYNLIKDNSSTSGRQRVLNRIKRMNNACDAVLLCFGEVDIRANVLKYCYQNSMSIEDCISDVVSRYLEFVFEIMRDGFKVMVYGGYGAGSDRTAVGTVEDRNYAAACLHSALSEGCKKEGIVYFSLHDCFFDFISLKTDTRFLVDEFHLYSKDRSLEQIQLLLIEQMYRSTKNLAEVESEQSSGQLVLGNLGSDEPLVKGYLKNQCLNWEFFDCPLKTIAFDLNAFVVFDSVTLLFDVQLDVDQMNFVLDGHPALTNALRNGSFGWDLHPAGKSPSFCGRYPIISAGSKVLLSLKHVVFKVKSLRRI